jgi:hypothetical protein
MIQQKKSFDQEHFVVSYELLKLLQWLIENEQDTLKKLLHNALNHGLRSELAQAHDMQQEEAEGLQASIVDFFSLLEALMQETLHESEAKNYIQRTMIPAIYHIDSNSCDTTSVALSIAKATAAVEKKTGEDPKDVLCKELLRRWKPSKERSAN